MNGKTRKIFGAMALSAGLAAALIMGGCKSSPTTATNEANGTAATSAAGATGAAAAAAGQAAVAPAETPEQAAAPAPERHLPVGTEIPVRITERLSASHNDVGDHFSGVVTRDVRDHGEVVLPRGTRVVGTVVAAKGRGKFKGAGALGIELTSIDGQHVRTSEYEKEVKGKGKRTAGFIGGGAGVGALIGGLAGGGKGAAIGALAGAGGGTAAGAYTGNKDVVIPSESVVRFRLEEPMRLQ